MTRRILKALGIALALSIGGLVVLAQGPIGPLANVNARSDSNAALMVTVAATSGSQGPIGPLAQVNGRSDSNGYLNVTIASGSATPDSLCLDATNHDTCLVRDAAGVLAQRNGTTGQAFNVYNTFTSATSYERAIFGYSASTLYIGTQKGSGGGSARPIFLGTNPTGVPDAAISIQGTTIDYYPNNLLAWRMSTAGNLITPTDNTYTIGATGTTRPAGVFLSKITKAASQAAGGTVNTDSDVTRTRYQITVAPATGDCSTAFIAGATTADCTIATLPAGMLLEKVYADVTVGFTCSGTCTGTKVMQCGITGAGTEILAANFNVATTGQAGDADAELGSAMTRAAAIQGGYLPSWSGTTPVVCRFTSGTGNWGSGSATFVNAGSVKFTLITEQIK